MLVLTRKSDESIRIGNDVVIKVIRTGKGTVKLGIEAPGDVRILRGELVDAAEPVAADADEDDDHPFTFETDEEFALPISVACGGYVALPAMA
ncbi:carbon storage regulator [Alienimonas chondri]|uniref:Translational regulator CsrA n=1 Tax=Alienimonas chondri TaxID=2681879 RepID=A0ABX1V947_9PLAN|nr:carbon storage regulator [Alienimonas chondri]NNJ24614.1 Carbon storage regulator [Alienimonas chondri]